MNKRVIFTEQQLKKIIGEDATGAYINLSSHGSEYAPSSLEKTDSEISVSEPTSDSDIDNNMHPTTTDDIRKNKTPKSYAYRGAYHAMYESEKKNLNERNKQMDDKKIFSLPNNLRQLAVSNGQNNEIMQKLASGEKMSLPQLYRMRNELSNNPNIDIKNGVDRLIKQAQNQGASLRNVQSNIDDMSIPNGRNGDKGSHRKSGGETIYYENN